jgi:predicted transcriptional regulator
MTRKLATKSQQVTIDLDNDIVEAITGVPRTTREISEIVHRSNSSVNFRMKHLLAANRNVRTAGTLKLKAGSGHVIAILYVADDPRKPEPQATALKKTWDATRDYLQTAFFGSNK